MSGVKSKINEGGYDESRYHFNMWGKIDGETLFVLLSEIVDTLPQAMKIVHQNSELTVIDYEIWKGKIQQYQQGAV